MISRLVGLLRVAGDAVALYFRDFFPLRSRRGLDLVDPSGMLQSVRPKDEKYKSFVNSLLSESLCQCERVGPRVSDIIMLLLLLLLLLRAVHVYISPASIVARTLR